jgi:hypothetical protein
LDRSDEDDEGREADDEEELGRKGKGRSCRLSIGWVPVKSIMWEELGTGIVDRSEYQYDYLSRNNADIPCSFETSSRTTVFPLLSLETSLTTSAPQSCAHALIALSRDSLVGRKRYGMDRSAFWA